MNETIVRYRGRYLNLVERAGWEYRTRSNASAVVVIIAVTDDDRLLLVEQLRRPLEARVIELPAGLVGDTGDPEEDVLEAANRELVEETGFEAESLEVIPYVRRSTAFDVYRSSRLASVSAISASSDSR